MFENLSYKQKFWALIGILLMLSIAAYKRSFSLTLNSYKEYKDLTEKLIYVRQNSSIVDDLDAEIRYLDQLIGSDRIEPELVQLEILNFVTTSSKKVNVVSVEEIHEAADNDFLIYTNQLIIEGSMQELLDVVYAFEKEFTHSRVINVSFFKKKDFSTKKIKLYAKIIFQNYERTNE